MVSPSGITHLQVYAFVPIHHGNPPQLKPVNQWPDEQILEMEKQNHHVWPYRLNLALITEKAEWNGFEIKLERVGVILLQFVRTNNEFVAFLLKAAGKVVVVRDAVMKNLI